jgi:CBS domain-containing protein
MKIRDVMVHDVVAIDPAASLAEAAQRMREANVGILPVVDDGQVCGVITDRDLVVRALAVGADLSATPVGECATADPVVAHPDWSLDQAMEAMARAQIGRLPVIDDDNTLAGIVTLGSLALRAKKDKETLAAAKAVSRRSVKESKKAAS